MSSNLSARTKQLRGVRQGWFKPLDFQSRDAWVRIPHALPTNFRANAECDYICEMSRHARLLVALSAWVVAQLAEHRTVTATVEGSTPFDPPKIIADFQLPIADCYCRGKRTIGNWQSTMSGTVAER